MNTAEIKSAAHSHNVGPAPRDAARPYAHWRVFFLIVIGLSFALAVGLPVAGYKIVQKFQMILFNQVMHDNETMANYFEAYLLESRQRHADEEEWLEHVRGFVNTLTMPNRGYVCVIDSQSKLQAYPKFDAPMSAAQMTLVPFDAGSDAFNVQLSVTISQLLQSSERSRLTGQFTNDRGSQLVDFRRIDINGKPWLIGIHQYESAVHERMKELFPYIVVLGVFLFLAIVVPFAIFTAFLIRQHENDRNAYISRIEGHSHEIEETARRLQDTNARLNQLQDGKNRLYARLSHDLRAPLNSIISSCSLVSDEVYGPATDKQKHAMTLVERNVNVLLDLIDGILELSRLESGQMKLEPEPFSLGGLIEELADNLRPLAKTKGLDVRVSAEAGLPPITTDRKKLYLVLQNLTGNAIKFTESGTIELSAKPDGDGVAISVRDTGPGIESGDQEAIFQEFTRAANGGQREASGVGLGLAITKELSALLGGSISLKSQPGEGSVFTVSLPLK